MMKTVPVQKAVGMVLCHDVTQIIPGQFKGPAFKRGHIVQPDDIPRLLSMGKERLYVWEMHRAGSASIVHRADTPIVVLEREHSSLVG